MGPVCYPKQALLVWYFSLFTFNFSLFTFSCFPKWKVIFHPFLRKNTCLRLHFAFCKISLYARFLLFPKNFDSWSAIFGDPEKEVGGAERKARGFRLVKNITLCGLFAFANQNLCRVCFLLTDQTHSHSFVVGTLMRRNIVGAIR